MSARALRLLPFVPLAALTIFAAVVVPVSLDSGAFLYMGRLLASGGTPYLAAWDHKGPLLYVLNALALRLGGDTPRGVLLVEALVTALALGWSMRIWAARIGERDAAWVGAALVLAYAMFWSSGNLSETVYFPAQLMAYTALLRCVIAPTVTDRDALVAGVLVGIAAAVGIGTRINNAMGIVAAAGMFVFWRRTGALGFVLVATVAASAVLGPVLWFFHSRGALAPMWDQYWIFNTTFNTATVAPTARIANAWFLFVLSARSPLALVTVASAYFLWRSGVRRPSPVLILGAGIVVLEFAAQLISGQGFRHYLVTTLASLTMYAILLRTSLAGAAESARAVWPRSRRFRVVAVTVLGFWGLSTVRAINAMKVRAYEGSSVGTAPLAEVAREVRARIPEGAPIYGSGNFAAVLAVTHHPSASRYFNDYPLLVAGYGPRHVRILATELTAKPPAAIVRVPGTCPIVEPAPECTPASVTLAAFARGRYTLRRSIGDYEVWIRNTP